MREEEQELGVEPGRVVEEPAPEAGGQARVVEARAPEAAELGLEEVALA